MTPTWLVLAAWLASAGAGPRVTPELAAQREAVVEALGREHGLDAAALERVRAIVAASDRIGQGNPAVTEHPMSEDACRASRAARPPEPSEARDQRVCGGPHMAPLYDPAREGPDTARVCIDRYEFPGIPCAYPLVWVSAAEAADLCEAVGKRLCDAHEWEGACAGALEAPDYRFDLARGQPLKDAVAAMRRAHNGKHAATKAWSYGPAYRAGVCGTGGRKSPGCPGGSWTQCGSNTFPAGAFPDCRSALGVYDQHGNAAEHMNLPLAPEQLASRGRTLGVVEMKGSWFIFDRHYAHEDWCRWRAPFWHGTKLRVPQSHRNYHLGFRCCKDVPAGP